MSDELFSVSTALRGRAAKTTRDAIRTVAVAFEGIRVRVLSHVKRPGQQRDKVFVVVGTHDVKRDARIVDVLCQIDDVDFDLVPAASEGMIPDDAQAIALD